MHFKKFFSKISLLLCLFVLPITNLVQASSIEPRDVYGGKWNTNVKIYIDTYDSAIRGSFLIAIDEWNTALSNINADIRISTVYNSADANVSLSVVPYYGAATAEVFWTPQSTSVPYSSARIIVNNNKFSNSDSIQQVNIAVHEMGHVLGLAHTTNGSYSVMDADISDYHTRVGVTSYDRQQLDRLY